MIIKSIRMVNFRQFKGDQKIEVSTDLEKNVTLIHAENSVGKTTILNSVLWCLFGRTTDRFEQKGMIVNFDAVNEGKKTALVEVEFFHEEKSYCARRTFDSDTKKSDLKVAEIDDVGSYSPYMSHPSVFINSVIPDKMASYFFFDGEQAENYASENNGGVIADAIRDIMGSKLIDSAINDLDSIQKGFNRQVGQQSNDGAIAQLEEIVSNLEQQSEQLKSDIPRYDEQINSVQKQLTRLDDELSGVDVAKSLSSERTRLEKDIENAKDDIKQARKDIVEWIPEYGFALIAKSTATRAISFVKIEASKGRIPAPYNERFVKDLLESKKCVCGRGLLEGTEEYKSVDSMLNKASNPELENIMARIRGRVESIEKDSNKAAKELVKHEQQLVRNKNRLAELEKRLVSIDQQLAKIAIPEVEEKEISRKKLKAELVRLGGCLALAQRDYKEKTSEISKKNAEIQKAAARNTVAQYYLFRRDIALACKKVLSDTLQSKEQEVKDYVVKEVNRILHETARRQYVFSLDSKYEIKLSYENGKPAPKSGGENQLVSLAFLSSIIAFAKKRLNDQKGAGVYVPSTLAPLVLDSPFGQLDKVYRAAVAKFVSTLAPQVIILVSSSQGNHEVLGALEERIGAEYVLVHYDRQQQGDRKQDIISRHGQDYVLSYYGQSDASTIIKRIK